MNLIYQKYEKKRTFVKFNTQKYFVYALHVSHTQIIN